MATEVRRTNFKLHSATKIRSQRHIQAFLPVPRPISSALSDTVQGNVSRPFSYYVYPCSRQERDQHFKEICLIKRRNKELSCFCFFPFFYLNFLFFNKKLWRSGSLIEKPPPLLSQGYNRKKKKISENRPRQSFFFLNKRQISGI